MMSEKGMILWVATAACLTFLVMLGFAFTGLVTIPKAWLIGLTILSCGVCLAVYRWVVAHDLRVILRILLLFNVLVLAIFAPQLP